MEILLENSTGSRMLPYCTATFSFWLQDCTGAHTDTQTHTRATENFTAAFFYYKTIRGPHTTRLHGGGGQGQPPRWWLLFFHRRKPIILYIIIIHLLHAYTHCDLDHSCSKLHISHYLHFLPQGGKFSLAAGKCSPLTFGNTTYFQISRRWGGSHVTTEVEGELLFLKKSLHPLGQTRPPYYWCSYRPVVA